MGALMRDILEFIVTVSRHWGRLMTGGFIVAVVGVYEHLTGRGIFGWPLWSAITVALFISFFLAWRDAHNKQGVSATHMLTIEAGTPLDNEILIVHDNIPLTLPGAEPIKRDDYIIKIHLENIRFVNLDIGTLVVREMSVSLLRMTKGRKRTAEEISKDSRPEVSSKSEIGKVVWSKGLTVEGRTMPCYELHGHLEIKAMIGERLDKNCFLRISMNVMGQPPYHLDFDVDWVQARNRMGCWNHIKLRTGS
jgi:hypothetical protein